MEEENPICGFFWRILKRLPVNFEQNTQATVAVVIFRHEE